MSENDVQLSKENSFIEIENINVMEVRPYDLEINELDWDPGEVEPAISSQFHNETSETEANQSDDDVNVRIRALEEEQEGLVSSLMALTTHFAQVQFRLHQIVKAPENERDILLKNLEDFADRGIPECANNVYDSRNILNKIDNQKNRQHELIEQLKNQLEDLEKYAYEAGEPVLPQSIILEKQKVIIDELKQKMNLNLNELDLPQLTTNELRTQVDQAIGEFVSPLKMKEQLVAQLKTQVNDLERFIKFLQGEKYEKKLLLKKQILKSQKMNFGDHEKNCDAISLDSVDTHDLTCNCNKTASNNKQNEVETLARTTSGDSRTSTTTTFTKSPPTNGDVTLSGKIFSVFSKASTLLQIFTLSQFENCSNPNQQSFKKNVLKKTDRVNHWGDIRARLEMEIQEVLSLAMEMKRLKTEAKTSDDEYESDRESMIGTKTKLQQTFRTLNIDLITIVRNRLSVTLLKLMQHGLRHSNETRNLMPFKSCFANFQMNNSMMARNDYYNDSQEMHAWELIVEYYKLNNGDYYNETPAQILSQSYNLDIVGDATVSSKHSLLYTIRNIITLHRPYKRSYNAHFKAFVCAGLNNHKLVHWLNQIFRCRELVNNYYTNWSYVVNTDFRDALKSLDQLTKYDFDLPIDLAIRQFQNIKDVF